MLAYALSNRLVKRYQDHDCHAMNIIMALSCLFLSWMSVVVLFRAAQVGKIGGYPLIIYLFVHNEVKAFSWQVDLPPTVMMGWSS